MSGRLLIFRRRLMVCAMVVLAPGARASDLPSPLRLADVLEAVRRDNPELAARRELTRSAIARSQASGRPEDPMVMLEWWQQPIDFARVPVMLTLRQPLPWLRRLRLQRRLAEQEVRPLQDEVEQVLHRLEAEARRAYFALVLAERSLAINQRLQKIVEDLADVSDARYRVGRAAQADVLRAQSERLVIENEQLDLERSRDEAVARLNGLMNRPASSSLGPTATAPAVVSLPAEHDLLSRALVARPAIRRVRDELVAAETRLALADQENLPQLTLWGAYMIDFRGVDGFTLGVSTTLPVFSTLRRRPLIEGGRAEVAAVRQMVASAERQADVEIRAALLALAAAARHVRLHRDQLIPLAELTLQSTLSAYETDRVDFLAVLAAAREVRMHHLDHARFIVDYERRRADLEEAVGQDIAPTGEQP